MSDRTLEISPSISFPEAIAKTKTLLESIAKNEISEAEIKKAIASLVQSQNGARGFFVTYLTDDSSLADNPTSDVIEALQTSPKIVEELLVKNIAMSSAMAVTHRRQHNEEMAQGSDRVCRRTKNLIEELRSPTLTEKLQSLQESATTGEGDYAAFLQKWDYDEAQRQVIQQAVGAVRK